MYTTIQGLPVDGDVVIRYQKTMIVQNDQGRHFCNLVGKPGAKSNTFGLPGSPRGPKPKPEPKPNQRTVYPIKVTTPDGVVQTYKSMRETCRQLGLSTTLGHKYANDRRVPIKGRFKGWQFEKVGKPISEESGASE